MLVAIIADFYALNQFHHEIGSPPLGGASIEDVSDVRMIHQGQRLPLRLKACNHTLRVHPRLNDLEGDATADRLLLFGDENDPASSLSNFVQKFVPADPVSRLFGCSEFGSPFGDKACRWFFEEVSDSIV